MLEVAPRELAENFAQIAQAARSEPVAVSEAGGVLGYVISARDYQRLLQAPRPPRPTEPLMSRDEFLDALLAARMSPEDDPEGVMAQPDPELEALVRKAR